MSYDGPYEKDKLKHRFRELAILAGFTVSAALVSVLVMDLIAFPITLLAVRKTPLFNTIVIFIIFAVIAAGLIYPLIKKVISLLKNGMGAGKIAWYLVKKTGHYSALFIVFLGISGALILSLYFLLYNNHYLLHRALNIL
ncbi:MAG TPA: hypothetical protein PK926_08400 [Spirochaetota bacterium]|nr:hypothetical protein [Spirochaetota bacterium]HPI89849.1 hypothetical protein [Spirochaetota bacterium]HPR48638.1 hypothetical protein [Spirochaetota bacterium]